VAAALVCGLPVTAAAASAYAPPAGWPDLGKMAVSPADFGAGAKVKRQGYVRPDRDSLAEYDREFRESTVKLGGKRLTGLEDDITLLRTTDDADVLIDSLRLGVGLASDEIGKSFARESGVKVTYTKIGKAISLGVGENSVAAVIRIGTRLGELRIVLGAVRVGQIDSAFYFVGTPRGTVGIPEAKLIARRTAAHIRSTLVPANTAAPTISGTAQAGQSLSALPGTWLSFPTGYTYQWQRCDVAVATCLSIPGATGLTYVPTHDDVGATLNVVVTAQNPYGMARATATSTSVVAAAPAPTS